jgi:hypothetical protein
MLLIKISSLDSKVLPMLINSSLLKSLLTTLSSIFSSKLVRLMTPLMMMTMKRTNMKKRKKLALSCKSWPSAVFLNLMLSKIWKMRLMRTLTLMNILNSDSNLSKKKLISNNSSKKRKMMIMI